MDLIHCAGICVTYNREISFVAICTDFFYSFQNRRKVQKKIEIFCSLSQVSFHMRRQSALMFLLSAVRRPSYVTNLCVCLISDEIKTKKTRLPVELADLIECRSA